MPDVDCYLHVEPVRAPNGALHDARIVKMWAKRPKSFLGAPGAFLLHVKVHIAPQAFDASVEAEVHVDAERAASMGLVVRQVPVAVVLDANPGEP